MLVDVWVYTPFIMILLLAGLRSLPTQPFEAAALDGVPRRFVFFRITLPMLTPYIITAALFRMLDSIQQFDIIYPMTQGGPGDTLLGLPGPRLSRILPIYERRQVGGASDHPVGDHLRAVERVHQTMAEAARARARTGVGGGGHGAHVSRSNASCGASLVALIVLFFLFPIFWIFLMSFQTNEEILRIPPSLFFTPTLSNYAALITGKLRYGGGHARHRVHEQPLEQRASLDGLGRASRFCSAFRRPTRLRASSSVLARTSPSPFCRFASRRRFWCCCPCRSISKSSA